MSLCEVTPDSQEAAGAGLVGDFVQLWSVGIEGPFRKLGHGVTEGRKASGTAWSSPGGVKAGAERADVERTTCQQLVGDLALQQLGAVHLHVCEEPLFRGPALGLLSMTGWAASDRADRREAEFAGTEKGTWACTGRS